MFAMISYIVKKSQTIVGFLSFDSCFIYLRKIFILWNESLRNVPTDSPIDSLRTNIHLFCFAIFYSDYYIKTAAF